MNPDPTRNQIEELHAVYVRDTGFALPLSMDREAAWYEWVRRGFTPGDVTRLINHHRWLAEHGQAARSLKFRSLVVNVDYAEEDLAEIRQKARLPKSKPNLEAVLKATGRTPPDGSMEPAYVKPSADIIAQLRAAAGLE